VTPPSLRGRLLVATPVLYDPNFDRSVVLLLEHGGDEGALGVVLNRPSGTELDDPLPAWAPLAADPPVVFVGGPVEPSAAIAIGWATGEQPSGWSPVLGTIGTVDLNVEPDDVADELDAVRIFAGYAGWGPGQLEGELEAGAWVVVDAQPHDAMTDDPGNLWRAVLRRQPGTVAWLANYPAEPSLN
jgi:putative transcriptional regulator